MTHPYLRPMNPGEIIAGAFRLFRDHLALLVQLALWPSLVLLGFQTLLLTGGEPTPLVFLLFAFLTVMINGLALIALTHGAYRALMGAEPGVRDTFVNTFRGRIAPPLLVFLFLNIVVSFPLSAGLLLGDSILFLVGLVPAILAGALFFPALPTCIVENRGTFSALARSMIMMRGRLNQGIAAFGFYVLITVFLPTLVLAVQLVVGLGPLTPLLFTIIGAVTLPLGYAAPLLAYLSAIAEEGAAPEHMASALGIIELQMEEGSEGGADASADTPANAGSGEQPATPESVDANGDSPPSKDSKPPEG